LDSGGNAFAFSIKKDNSTKTRFFQRVGINKHFAHDVKEGILDVESRKRLVRKRLEPTSNTFQKIIIDD